MTEAERAGDGLAMAILGGSENEFSATNPVPLVEKQK